MDDSTLTLACTTFGYLRNLYLCWPQDSIILYRLDVFRRYFKWYFNFDKSGLREARPHHKAWASPTVWRPFCKTCTSKDVTNKEVTSKDVTNKDVTSKDVTSKDVTSKDVTSKDVTSWSVTSTAVTGTSVTSKSITSTFVTSTVVTKMWYSLTNISGPLMRVIPSNEPKVEEPKGVYTFPRPPIGAILSTAFPPPTMFRLSKYWD